MATNVSLSDFVNATIEAYVKKAVSLPNTKYWLNNNLKTQIINHGGETLIYVPMQTQIPESAFMSAENVANPSAAQPAFVKGTLYLKKIVAPMRFSEETVALNQGPNVIVKNLETITSGTLQAYNMAREFQMHQDGSGILCHVVTATSTTSTSHTITVDSARWLRVGMILDGYTAATPNGVDMAVTDVNYDTNVVTLTTAASPTIAAGDHWYYANTYTGGTYAATYFCNGIEHLINDSDAAWSTPSTMGFDRDTQSFAKAVVKYGASAGTAEALTLGRMRSVCDSIDVNAGEVGTELIYCGMGAFNAYQEVLRNENQPTVSMPASGGYPDGLEFVYNGKKIRIVSSRLVADVNTSGASATVGSGAANGTMYFIDPKHLIKYKGGDVGWDTMAGSLQKVAGYQQYERVYRGWENYGCDFFKKQGRLNDITTVA
jgi:hypothetical protein